MTGLGKLKQCTKFEVASVIHCVNIEGKPKILGSSPSPWSHTLSSACDFMMGLDEPQLRAKFEVASPSRCRNIVGKQKKFGELPWPYVTPFISLGVI